MALLSPARIMLTGGAGFVGRHLVSKLRATFPTAEIFGAAAADETLDVTDGAAVAARVRAAQPDACIHLAAISAIPAATSDPDLAWRVNLHGTLAVARAILREAPACRLVFASSAEVYGQSFRSGAALDETAVLAPGNTYAATKAAADLALGSMVGAGLRVVRVRPFNHVGAGQSARFVVAAFARQVARIEAGRQPAFMRVGSLAPLRDFLDVQDVCDAYVACLRASALEPGIVLNIASGVARRIGDVLEALCRLAGVDPTIETDAKLLRSSEIAAARGDAARARALLGWMPTTGWDDTLRTVLDDWRQRVRDATDGDP